MFHHVKELQFNARVSEPDPTFASILQEQFGGGNGELKAMMQYFVQAFGMRQPYPKLYDLLMDIATEEFSHLEIVGATITMLMGDTNAQLKNAVEQSYLNNVRSGNKEYREDLIHQAFVDPQLFVLSGGGPKVTDSQGAPWSGSFVNANGDPTVDMRSNIAAESRAKIVYEYLMQFTDDPYVIETLQFLMSREIAHFQMFQAALDSIEPNFPPGVLQGDPRMNHLYFNMSNGVDVRGPWNEGKAPLDQGDWHYVEDPVSYVRDTNGLLKQESTETSTGTKDVQNKDKELSEKRSNEIRSAITQGANQWSAYPQKDPHSP